MKSTEAPFLEIDDAQFQEAKIYYRNAIGLFRRLRELTRYQRHLDQSLESLQERQKVLRELCIEFLGSFPCPRCFGVGSIKRGRWTVQCPTCEGSKYLQG